MNTLICAGGSGIRTFEALLHLCAAGLGPKELRVLAIDPDRSNGNATRTHSLLNAYKTCQGFLSDMGADGWFGTKFDLLGDADELKVWSPVETGERLRDVINYDNLEQSDTKKEIAHLFFTPDEIEVKLDGGFLGHPAIGAACMGRVFSDPGPLWTDLAKKVEGDLSLPGGSRVFIAGSVFGGTGAASLYPITRFLRSASSRGSEKLKVAIGALLPFFRFTANPNVKLDAAARKMVVKSEMFPITTKAAIGYYDFLKRHGDWPFDGVFWVGDSGLTEVDYAPIGADQTNPAHFVELILALAAAEHFETPVTSRASLYAGPRQNEQPPPLDQNLCDWDDLPLLAKDKAAVREKLLSFHLAGAAHLGFFESALKRDDLDQRAKVIPWYFERFARSGQSLREPKSQEDLKSLSDYFRKYYFPWWRQITASRSTDVRLFNPQALESNGAGVQPRLDFLDNLLWTTQPGRTSVSGMDRFFSDTVENKHAPGGKGVAAYCNILNGAARQFIQRDYHKKA